MHSGRATSKQWQTHTLIVRELAWTSEPSRYCYPLTKWVAHRIHGTTTVHACNISESCLSQEPIKVAAGKSSNECCHMCKGGPDYSDCECNIAGHKADSIARSIGRKIFESKRRVINLPERLGTEEMIRFALLNAWSTRITADQTSTIRVSWFSWSWSVYCHYLFISHNAMMITSLCIRKKRVQLRCMRLATLTIRVQRP